MWELKFKRKPKPEVFTEKQAYVPQTREYSPGMPSQITTAVNHVTKVFNDYCTEMGVQVTVGMNPTDYTRQMYLKVVGNRDVQIDHRGKTYYLAPGESYTLTISESDCMTGRTEEFLPRLTLMPYGNVAAQQNVGMRGVPTRAGLQRQFFQYGILSSDMPHE
jgi:hypothetical protein